MSKISKAFQTTSSLSLRKEGDQKDYEEVLIPAVDAAFKHHARIRLYYELGSQYTGFEPGAAWEDMKSGPERLTGWGRAAVVTDVDWIRHVVNALGVASGAGIGGTRLACRLIYLQRSIQSDP